jgi:hypothetical protein
MACRRSRLPVTRRSATGSQRPWSRSRMPSSQDRELAAHGTAASSRPSRRRPTEPAPSAARPARRSVSPRTPGVAAGPAATVAEQHPHTTNACGPMVQGDFPVAPGVRMGPYPAIRNMKSRAIPFFVHRRKRPANLFLRDGNANSFLTDPRISCRSSRIKTRRPRTCALQNSANFGLTR